MFRTSNLDLAGKRQLGATIASYRRRRHLEEENSLKSASLIQISGYNSLHPTKVDVEYPLTESGASAHLSWDQTRQELVYGLKSNVSSLEDWQDLLEAIEYLLTDPFIHEVEYNSDKGLIEVYHQRYGILGTNLSPRQGQLQRLMVELAADSDQQLSYEQPLLASELAGEVSLQACLSPELTRDWPHFQLTARGKTTSFSPRSVLNSINPDLLAYLWLCVEHKRNVVVVSDGKLGQSQQLVSFLASYLPHDAKLAVIGGADGLQLTGSNLLYPPASKRRSLTEEREKESKNDFISSTALKQCLRENPDYLLLPDWQDPSRNMLLQSLASGQPLMAASSQERSQFLPQDPKATSQLADLLHVLVAITGELTAEPAPNSGFADSGEQGPISIYELGTRDKRKSEASSDLELGQVADSSVLQQLARELGWGAGKISERLKEKKETISWIKSLSIERLEEHSRLVSIFGNES